MNSRKLVNEFDARFIGCHFKLFHLTGGAVHNGDTFELIGLTRAYVGQPAVSTFRNVTNPDTSASRISAPHIPGDMILAECLGNPADGKGPEPDPEEERVAWGLMMDARDHIISSREKFRAAVLAAAKQMERDTGGLFLPLSVEIGVMEVTAVDSKGPTYTVTDVEVRTTGGFR